MKTEKDSDLVVWIWAFLGAFAGVAVVEVVFMNWRFMAKEGVPIIVGSYVSSCCSSPSTSSLNPVD